MSRRVKQVISYTDDVYVWVYLDYVDRVLRYEAFVVDYDEQGEQTTLQFVLEEGVLDNLHEIPLFVDMLHREAMTLSPVTTVQFSVDGRLITTSPVLRCYAALSEQHLNQVHSYFQEREHVLKTERRTRWIRSLKALGYDVIDSL